MELCDRRKPRTRALGRDTLSPPGDSSAAQICILLPQIKVPLLSHSIRERVANVVPVGGSNLMSEMNDEAVPLLSHLLCYRQERKHERVEAGCVSVFLPWEKAEVQGTQLLTPRLQGDKSLFPWRGTVSVTWWGGLGESCTRLGPEQGCPCREGVQLALSAAVTWALCSLPDVTT